ncbi:MAG: TonB-dependent receptor [Acidobacteria bacterium]|nr:TonB-dependent receptor [Acidobacteriota bacterium]
MRLCFAVSVIFFISSPARAERSDEQARAVARAHYATGTSMFDLGRYDEAIAEYEAAYKAMNEPSLLYNIGQAHRLAGHPSQAIRFYRTYLTRVPNAENREEVHGKIAALERVLDEQRASSSSGAKPSRPTSDSIASPQRSSDPRPPAAPIVAPTALSPTPPNALSGGPSPTTSLQRSGRPKRIAGLVTASVGAGVLATGIVFGVLAKNASDAITQADRAHAPFDQGKYDAGKTDQILEGVLLGVGAAAVVSGAVLYGLGHRERKRAFNAQLIPQLAHTYAGISVRVGY